MTEKDINIIKPALPAGILSAASAALMWLSLLNVPFLPVFFGIGVNIPVFFTVFSYGLRSGFIAVLLAGLLLCFILPIAPALLLAVFFFIPALFTGWLLGLKTDSRLPAMRKNSDKRPAVSHAYPLSAALFQLALIIAFVTIAVLFYSFSMVDLSQAFDDFIKQITGFIEQKNLYDMPAQNSDIHAVLRRYLPILFAVSLALYGFLFQLAALYCAMRLARQKNVLKRPFGYWPADLRMPPMALFLFVGLWIATYFIDSPGFAAAPTLALCVNIILAALAAGFCVSGLAVLHQVTRGSWLWLRIIIYICLFSVILTPVIFFGLVIMGLFATPFSSGKQDEKPPLP